MKTAVCCIIKDENSYLREFVEWHKNLGFDNIILYDNNFSDGENIVESIGDYISNGYVKAIDVRNMKTMQLSSYNHCIKTFGNEYDWIAFFDCDEHLHLPKDRTIQNFLTKFDDSVDSVVVNWMIMDDNDLIHNDGRPLEERFTRMSNVDHYSYQDVKENQHIKTILRCTDINVKQAFFPNPHFVFGIKNCVDANGQPVPVGSWKSDEIKHDTAYLKHFQLKTIEEFMYNRFLKGAPDVDFDFTINHRNTVEKFFKMNKRTKEKEKIVEKFMNENQERIKQRKMRG